MSMTWILRCELHSIQSHVLSPDFPKKHYLNKPLNLKIRMYFEGLHLNWTHCYTMFVPLPFIFQTIQLPGSLSQTSCLWSLGMSGQGDGSYRSIGIEESRRGPEKQHLLFNWEVFVGLIIFWGLQQQPHFSKRFSCSWEASIWNIRVKGLLMYIV